VQSCPIYQMSSVRSWQGEKWISCRAAIKNGLSRILRVDCAAENGSCNYLILESLRESLKWTEAKFNVRTSAVRHRRVSNFSPSELRALRALLLAARNSSDADMPEIAPAILMERIFPAGAKRERWSSMLLTNALSRCRSYHENRYGERAFPWE
jgi:hypothetical protein